MALALKDRVKETTIVVGTGAATLLGSSIGFQPFSVVGNGNTTYYCISDQFGSNWEVGIGTYSSSGNTLARTTVLASSNAGALVVFTTGVKDVFVTYPAEKGVWYDASGNVLFTGTTTAANLAYTGTLTGGTGVIAIGTNQIYKDASGNVGIGTSSPSYKLDVNGAVNLGGNIFTTPNSTIYNASGDLYIRAGTSGALKLGANGTNSLMTLDSSGNLLVGTTSPILNSVLSIAQRNSTGNGSSTLTLDHYYANNKYINFGWYGTTIGSISQTSGTSIVINSPALTFQTGSIDRMIVDSSGNLLVGTPSQFGSGKVCVSYDGTVYNGVALRTTNAALNSNFVTFYNSATTNCGGISQNGTTTVNYITSSDYRLKENIAPMIGALDKIANLNPVTYIWKDTDNEVGEGFIAHELQAICPLAVSGEKDAVNKDGSIKAQGIDPSKLVALLTASIQELKAIIDTQQEQINSLLGK